VQHGAGRPIVVHAGSNLVSVLHVIYTRLITGDAMDATNKEVAFSRCADRLRVLGRSKALVDPASWAR